MTLSTTTSRVSYAANGATTVFAFSFKVWAASNLKVYLRNNATLLDTLLTLGSDYTVDIVSYPNTGNVVFFAAPGSGQTVVIVRDMPLTQDLDLIASGAFAAENVEVQLDKLAAEIQTLRELVARSPRFAVGTNLADIGLPEPRAGVANQLLGVTAAGDGYDLKVPANLSLQTVSSFMGTLLDDPDAATARATLGIGSAVDLNLLTTDSTGGAANDLCPFVDADEANASNKVTFQTLIYNLWNNFAQDASPDHAADFLVSRDVSAAVPKKVLLGHVGVGKQTIWVPAGSMTARTTAGAAAGTVETATNRVMLRTLDFDASVAEFAQFSVQMPKGWNEGTVSALFVWSHAATATNFNVVWGIQGVAVSDDDALDVAFGTAQTVTDTGGTTNDLYRSAETAAVTIGGTPTENDVVIFQVYRDATNGSDTLAIDVRLHGVALFYTTNTNTDN
ncbi:MAG: hypothetical protein KBA31_19425 [Alphaproteobacteria bacterium]|nr:hypothetical protein [Alphaproteobacteria bacterium]